MGTTSELLVQILFGLGGVLTFLFLFIVANKAMRELRERRVAALRRELEPKILAYVNGQGERLGPQLGASGRLERAVAEEILLDHARFLKGAARDRITAACEELGFVQNRLSQLRHARWWKRAEAAEKLGAMKSAKAAPELIALIESARGVLNAAAIAPASLRMAALVFGSADYVKDIRCRPGADRAELLLALQQIVLAARSAGIDAIDAPCFDLRNPVLLRREACQARRLGFDGKNALHPDQIGPINEVFDVTPEEIEWARKVVAELAAAEDSGRALSTLDGQLIDNPHKALAERILSRAGHLDK